MKLPLIDVLKDSKLINADTASLLNFIDREQARRACLQVALSAQAYYRDHDEFPDRLADYEAVVYSRFTNEIDDGGTMVTYGEARPEELRDFGFRIRTPRYPPLVAPRP